jgi:hypothetical protein
MGRLLSGMVVLLITPVAAGSRFVPDFSSNPSQEPAAGSSHAPAEAREKSRELEPKIASVTTSDVNALADALGVRLVDEKAGAEYEESPLSEDSQLRLLGKENEPGPQCVLFLAAQEAGEDGHSAAENWTLDYLAWDGTRWKLSPLDQPLRGDSSPANWKSHTQPLGVKILSHASGEHLMALILYDAPATSVYPVAYRVKDHQATLVWDSRSEDSRYEALSGGRVKFVPAQSAGIPAMVASGKADPGLLVFERGGSRGFEERTTYVWKDDAYVPSGTEVEANEDFRLYEFVSALHLHNFQSAYALIDPAKFLGSDKPSLDAFRDVIQKSWSEFLDDHIFTASEAAAAGGNGHAFELDEGGKKSKYLPTFSPGPKFLLTGVKRQEE